MLDSYSLYAGGEHGLISDAIRLCQSNKKTEGYYKVWEFSTWAKEALFPTMLVNSVVFPWYHQLS